MTLIERTRILKESSYRLAAVSEDQRNEALKRAAAVLRKNTALIIAENIKDLEKAKSQQLANSLIKRLSISESKLEQMAEGLESLAALPDPLGKSSLHRELDEGLVLSRYKCSYRTDRRYI